MNDIHPRLLDFAPFLPGMADTVGVIRDFAAASAYRSATVEELALDPESSRRPLRPEDLEFLKFRRPVTPETACRLPSLAAQRLLFCLNEASLARLPAGPSVEWSDYLAVRSREQMARAATLRPVLQSFAMGYAESAVLAEAAPLAAGTEADGFAVRQAGIYAGLLRAMAERDFTKPALAFALVQLIPLREMQARALEHAEAAGVFDPLPPGHRPRLTLDGDNASLVTRLLAAAGVEPGQHVHWQFYLAASLARPNIAWAYATSPAHALESWGAFFALEADWNAAGCLVGQGATALCNATPDPAAWNGLDGAAPLGRRMEAALDASRQIAGAEGPAAVMRGFAVAAQILSVAAHELAVQLTWLSDMDAHVAAAQLLSDRIERENPGIDRETFVEPREMCSTTHVHNDHRLVVIEEGDMIFWGYPGMELDLHPGDKVLIPCGRLHGSTVTSPECTYHQPIIPEDWMVLALEQAHGRNAAA